MRRLFPEREILLRSEGTLRFLKISSKVQIGIAAAAVVALMLWAAAAIFMLVGQYGVARDRAILDEQQAAIASSAKKVSTYRASVTETAKELEQIGRAHVCTPVTNAHLVCRLQLAKKNY